MKIQGKIMGGGWNWIKVEIKEGTSFPMNKKCTIVIEEEHK